MSYTNENTNEMPMSNDDDSRIISTSLKVLLSIINDGETDLKYLALGTKKPYDICEYPDSDKILSRITSEDDLNLWNMSKGNESYDYFEGEE